MTTAATPPTPDDAFLADCLRYLCMARLKYVRPRARKHKGGYTTEYLRQKKDREKARRAREGGWGGSIRVG